MKKYLLMFLAGFILFGASSVWAGGFEEWCGMYGITADQGGDPDGDGSENLFEYAYGGDPTNSNVSGVFPEMRLVEDGGVYYVETERLERRNQNPEDDWSFYAVLVTEDLEFGMWSSAVCTEVSRSRYGITNYDLVILRTAIPLAGGWTPPKLYYREYGAAIYAYMGGVYFGSIERTHYTYPFAEHGSRMIGDILDASAWDYLEIAEGDGLTLRVDWNSVTGEWDDPTATLPQAGYGFTGWRLENAEFFPNYFGKLIPYESVDIYCPKGETLIGNPYPEQCILDDLISDPTEGDMVDIWDSNLFSYVHYSYMEASGPPMFNPAGWVDYRYTPVGLVYITEGESVRYTTSKPKVLTFYAPANEYFQGSADQTFLALSEREISRTAEASGTLFDVYSLGGSEVLSYSISDDVPWISCSPFNGTTSGEHDTVNLSFDVSGLPAGTYTGYVSVVSSEAANSPQKVQVVMEVVEVVFESVSISGATSINSGSTNSYVCTANYTDGSHSNVTGSAQWSVSGAVAAIDSAGTLIAGQVALLEQVTVSASYSDGGITKTNTFDVVVKNPSVELDYSYIGGPANPLILSNQVFIGNSGSNAAEIGQIAALEVYDCTFQGGEEGGTGLLMQSVDSIFITTSLPDYEARGGDGESVDNQTPGADIYVRGGVGVRCETTSNIVIESMQVVGGNGGEIQAHSEFIGTGSVAGGDGMVIAEQTGYRTIRIDDGSYAGGNAGGIWGISSPSLEGRGGHGAKIQGSIFGGELVVSNGVFSGGSGGFLMDSGGNADGGSGLFINQQATTIFGGIFSGASSGLGDSVNGGHGVYAYGSDIEISGGSFTGGAGYDATYAGSGVRLENSTAIISGGVFAGEAYGGKLSAGLRVESSSADVSGGNFDSICFSSGGNSATFSGSPMIETLLQVDGISDIVLSGFYGSIETARVEGGTMTVSGDIWTLVFGSEIEITEVATLLVGELQALSGSQITTEIGATFAGTNLTFESGCDWTIDASGAGVTGVVELATASVGLVSSLIPSDMTLLGDGSTYVSSVFTSNSTLYAILEEIPIGFDAWVEGITNVNLRGHADCPDGDGVANLMKYACGFPAGSIVSNLFDYTAFSATSTNSAYITITYQKAKNLSDADVYPIQTGSLLGNVSPWASAIRLYSWKSGEDGDHEIWRSSIHGITNGFIRLKAEVK